MIRKGLVLLLLAALIGQAAYSQLAKKEQPASSSPKIPASIANSGLEVGKEAPDFELQTYDGKTVKLSDYRGKKVILNFWATWCPPCQKEVPEMQAFYGQHQRDVVILAVNYTVSEKSGAQEKVAAFVTEHKLTFPVLMDSLTNVSATYKIISLPTSYFIDTKGVMRQKFIGPMTQEFMKKSLDKLE
ncbi:peroxiredoxin family protein [Ectobacillus ponti]|uniref:TlpA family protein disulfide reductase n=1 Tax=Ectobacillus ponti TaxID=2961894 RepID=A0AA42BQ82_9BACI|nr:TlpA disulfide reductase family protein [Ectobacillus ponti]MCP8969131.1 TlpA family protein disulfide reductase [Ectobacillus ponti]